MDSVYLTCEEIKDSEVHEVEQAAPTVVRRRHAHVIAVVVLRLPHGLPTFVVRTPPRVPRHLQVVK